MSLTDEQLEELSEAEAMLLEPRERYDQCLIGVGHRFHNTFAVYDEACVLRVIEEDGYPYDPDEDPAESAQEHFDFNILGGWVGDGTPAFLSREDE